MVRYVLFDAVGTLLRPSPPVAEAYRAAAAAFGVDLPRDTIAARFRNSFQRAEARDAGLGHRTSEDHERQRWRQIVGEVFQEVTPIEPLFAMLWEHFALPQHWVVHPEADACLPALIARGYSLGIASNFDGRLAQICSNHSTLVHLPRFVSSQLGFKKPALEFFRAIERELPAAPEEILLIGDDLENDYFAARRAGWHTYLLLPPGRCGTPPGVEHCLRSLAQLPALLS